MSGLRIVFEVEEKHVGRALVALEDIAKNLNFTVVKEVDWNRNVPRGTGKKNGTGTGNRTNLEHVLGIIQGHQKGIEHKALLAAVRATGAKSQGVGPIVRSLVRNKRVKKVAGLYLAMGVE
jgi:hypothetical protein